MSQPFSLSARNFEPAYLALHRSGELQWRAEQAVAGLVDCTGCPRRCEADRLVSQTGTCQIGRYARVSSYFPHLGEEDCLRGWRGSGTIFFAQCNLRCVFCQNYDISQEGQAPETPPERLAEMMLELQAMGCHNINFVTPTHVVAQILEALVLASAAGLQLPLVYNTSGYDTLETLQRLDGVIDIYMPDFKIWDPAAAARYLQAGDYPQTACLALREMHRQVGELKLDEDGLAKRGMLVRHLVMPGDLVGTESVMRFLAIELSPHTYVNLMAQYRPAGKVTGTQFAEINRLPTQDELARALSAAREAGLYRFD